MLHVAIYNVVLAATCGYAFIAGGQPERLATFGWAVACAATFLLPFSPARSYHAVEAGALAIDSAVLVWFIAIALLSTRFWPMWLAATHLLTVAVHGVKGYEPDLLPSVYALASTKLGYPMLLLLVIGIARHRARVVTFGSDDDWRFPRWMAL